MKTTKTQAQADRCNARDTSGKFIKNPCDCCGKGCPMDYFSDDRAPNTFLTLHARCAANLEALSTEEHAQTVAFFTALRNW